MVVESEIQRKNARVWDGKGSELLGKKGNTKYSDEGETKDGTSLGK